MFELIIDIENYTLNSIEKQSTKYENIEEKIRKIQVDCNVYESAISAPKENRTLFEHFLFQVFLRIKKSNRLSMNLIKVLSLN